MARALPSESLAPDIGRRAGRRSTSLWREAAHRFGKHRLAMMGTVILLTMVTAVAIGPFVYPRAIDEIDFKAKRGTPSRRIRWAPTTWGRTCWPACSTAGASRSLSASPRAVALTRRVVGAIAGFFGGFVDHILMRITDLFIPCHSSRSCC